VQEGFLEGAICCLPKDVGCFLYQFLFIFEISSDWGLHIGVSIGATTGETPQPPPSTAGVFF
jgi:hypothetical protein